MADLDGISSQTVLVKDRFIERRNWQRLLSKYDYQVAVRVESNAPQSVLVRDASIAGISLVLDDATISCVGQSAEVTIGDQTLRGVIRNVTPVHGEKYRVGLYWTEPHIEAILSLTTRTQHRCDDKTRQG